MEDRSSENLTHGRLTSEGRYFEVIDGKFRLTAAGEARYRERFARAGFDISRIDSSESFERALEGSFHIEWDAAAEQVLSKKYVSALEADLLRAALRGDEAEKQRIEAVLRRRHHLGLHVITGGANGAPRDQAGPPVPPPEA